jgi:hypothetical protein
MKLMKLDAAKESTIANNIDELDAAKESTIENIDDEIAIEIEMYITCIFNNMEGQEDYLIEPTDENYLKLLVTKDTSQKH